MRLLLLVVLNLFLLLTTRVVSERNDCPPRCLCFRTTVRCMFLQLNAVPPRISAQTTVLDLRFNRIRIIPSHSFRHLKHLNTLLLNNNQIARIEDNAFLGLKELRYLYLYKNRISSVSKHAFRGLPKLEQLYMHFNKIPSLEDETFGNLPALERLFLHHNQLVHVPQKAFQRLESLRRLRLDSNALICDCQLLWLVEMLEDHQTEREHIKAAATCHGPGPLQGKNLQLLRKGDFHCRRPNLLKEPTDVEVSFGGTAYFHCQTEGDPDPHITWYHNSNEIVPDPEQNVRLSLLSEGTTLMIKDAKDGDQGLYECMARNAAGQTKSRAALMKVKQGSARQVSAPEFLVEPTDVRVTVGSEAVFHCRARGHPSAEITWMRNNSVLSTGEPQRNAQGRRFRISEAGSMTITQVRAEDAGAYFCLASNFLGRITAKANLLVNFPARILDWPNTEEQLVGIGQSVDLFCRVEGQPNPLITWSKDGRPLEPRGPSTILNNGAVLRLAGVRSVHTEGIYSCQAQNEAGRDARQIRVRVISPDLRTAETLSNTATSTLDISSGRTLLESSVIRAGLDVDRSINNTLAELFQNRSTAPSFNQLLRAFRFPTPEAREVGRAAEVFQRSMELLHHHLQNTNALNSSLSSSLKPEELRLLANLSGCLVSHEVDWQHLDDEEGPCDDWCFHSRFRSVDGLCNNLQRPRWGAALTAFRRVLPAKYEDEMQEPIGWSPSKRSHGFLYPNARLISRTAVVTRDVTPDPDYSHMLMQWGQFLDHDLDFSLPALSHSSFSDGSSCLSSCSNRAPCFPILIPEGDTARPFSEGQVPCIELVRSSALCGTGLPSLLTNQTSSREQVNQLTSFIDASNVYGSSHQVSNLVRDRTSRGLLRTSRHGGRVYLPFAEGFPMDCQRDRSAPSVACFLAGDVRANEQLGLLSMHTLWVREHNRLATRLSKLNNQWDSNRLYYESRKIVGAIMQRITYTHWLPKILGSHGIEMLGKYEGYNPELNPSISNVFATAVLRFGHTLINPVLERLDSDWKSIPEGPLPLHKAFFAPHRLLGDSSVDILLRGLAGAPAKLRLSGQLLNEELINKLFTLARGVALDLGAINIQRSRDHGIPGYTQWRTFCNMSRIDTFDHLRNEIKDPRLRKKLKELYGHPDNIDLWVGGISEDLVEGARVGPTFRCLLVEQFRRLRDADRFWYENPGVFSPAQLLEIRRSSLASIMCSSGDAMTQMTADVFLVPGGNNPVRECRQLSRVQLQPWKECCSQSQECNSFSNSVSVSRYQRSLNEDSTGTEHSTTEDEDASDVVVEIDHQAALDASDSRVEGLEETLQQVNHRLRQMQKKLKRLRQGDNCSGNATRSRHCWDSSGQRRSVGDTWSTSEPCQQCSCNVGGQVLCQVTSPCPVS